MSGSFSATFEMAETAEQAEMRALKEEVARLKKTRAAVGGESAGGAELGRCARCPRSFRVEQSTWIRSTWHDAGGKESAQPVDVLRGGVRVL